MAIGGAFLGGGVELVPAGSCKLELEAYTDNATVSATFTITGGGNTYTVTSGTDGRASKVVPSGVTYTVSATVTGYTAPPSQTVIAESSSIKYVRFDAQLKKAQGDISTLQADVDKAEGDISTLKTDVGNAQGDISTLQTDVKRAQSTADSKAGTDVATQSANGLMSKDDKIKLDGIEDTYATITAVQTAQSTADGKVSKSGDTMTGELLIQKSNSGYPLKLEYTTYNSGLIIKRSSTPIDADITDSTNGAKLYFQDAGDVSYAGVITQKEGRYNIISLANYKSGVASKFISLYSYSDGSAYGVAPSWSVGTNDNSDKILTIRMANSLPSLVHTTGNETIAGTKIFTASDVISKASDRDRTAKTGNGNGWGYAIYDKNQNIISAFYNEMTPTSSATVLYALAEDSSGQQIYDALKLVVHTDRTSYATAPTTPTNASKKEIVTANWALNKFQRKITYGTGDPPSGGQAGDIYIKI